MKQQDQVMAYVSRQLKNHKWNYLVHNLELVAIIFALKMGRHDLYGVTFEIYNDHESLKYLFT